MHIFLKYLVNIFNIIATIYILEIFEKLGGGGSVIDKELNERISITLNKELLEKLDIVCKEECRTRSKMIEYVLIQYLSKK